MLCVFLSSILDVVTQVNRHEREIGAVRIIIEYWWFSTVYYCHLIIKWYPVMKIRWSYNRLSFSNELTYFSLKSALAAMAFQSQVSWDVLFTRILVLFSPDVFVLFLNPDLFIYCLWNATSLDVLACLMLGLEYHFMFLDAWGQRPYWKNSGVAILLEIKQACNASPRCRGDFIITVSTDVLAHYSTRQSANTIIVIECSLSSKFIWLLMTVNPFSIRICHHVNWHYIYALRELK